MVSARKLLYDFDREFARFNTSPSKVLSIVDKFAIINKAERKLFADRVKKAELNSEIRAEIRPFEIKEKQILEGRKESKFNVYTYPEDYYKRIRATAHVSKEPCGSKELPVVIFQSDSIDLSRNNPYWRSDFRWEQIVADDGAEGLFIWHEGDMNIDKVTLDYYRKPQEIHGPTLKKPQGQYKDWNGVIRTEDQGSEMSAIYSDITTIQVAVLDARAIVSDIKDYQIQLRQILDTVQVLAT